MVEYQLTITFAELGRDSDLPDRLLGILLERIGDSGPVLAYNQATGTLTVILAFISSEPIDDASRLSKGLGVAMSEAGVKDAPTIVDVHLTSAHEGNEDTAALGVLAHA